MLAHVHDVFEFWCCGRCMQKSVCREVGFCSSIEQVLIRWCEYYKLCVCELRNANDDSVWAIDVDLRVSAWRCGWLLLCVYSSIALCSSCSCARPAASTPASASFFASSSA